jgi:DNA polymerase-3 subunit gamma/tau
MGNQEKLSALLIAAFGVETVSLVLGETAGETPAEKISRARADQHERAVAAIESDQFVRNLIEALDASVIDASVRSCAG